MTSLMTSPGLCARSTSVTPGTAASSSALLSRVMRPGLAGSITLTTRSARSTGARAGRSPSDVSVYACHRSTPYWSRTPRTMPPPPGLHAISPTRKPSDVLSTSRWVTPACIPSARTAAVCSSRTATASGWSGGRWWEPCMCPTPSSTGRRYRETETKTGSPSVTTPSQWYSVSMSTYRSTISGQPVVRRAAPAGDSRNSRKRTGDSITSTPTVPLPKTGLTTTGQPRSSAAAGRPSSRNACRKGATGTPAAASLRFITYLLAKACAVSNPSPGRPKYDRSRPPVATPNSVGVRIASIGRSPSTPSAASRTAVKSSTPGTSTTSVPGP